MAKENKKADEYCKLILNKISELFRERDDLWEEFEDSDNCTSFIHALANMAPTVVYNNMTSNEIDMLDFNHLANRVCVQNLNFRGPSKDYPKKS